MEKQVETVVDKKEVNAQDILNRSSEVKAENPVDANSGISLEDLKLNPNDINNVKDPVARKMLEDRYKIWESGFNKKFQEIANMRKQLEDEKVRASQPQPWSKDRVREMLRDPNFASSVEQLKQEIAPGHWEGTEQEWSALTTQEKQQFQQLTTAFNKQQVQLNNLYKAQEDEVLKKKFPDYKPELVDSISTDLSQGKIGVTREDIWKVTNFETAVERAYRLGLQDRMNETTHKINASSAIEGSMNTTASGQVPEEVKKQGFTAIAKWRLANFGK